MMEDYRQNVCTLAQRMLGELTTQEIFNLNSVADAVCLYVNARLKKDISNSSCTENYILACALYCVDFMRSLQTGEIAAFTAGTVSLSFGQNRSSLTQTADRLLSPWLASGTVFCGVRT